MVSSVIMPNAASPLRGVGAVAADHLSRAGDGRAGDEMEREGKRREQKVLIGHVRSTGGKS